MMGARFSLLASGLIIASGMVARADDLPVNERDKLQRRANQPAESTFGGIRRYGIPEHSERVPSTYGGPGTVAETKPPVMIKPAPATAVTARTRVPSETTRTTPRRAAIPREGTQTAERRATIPPPRKLSLAGASR